MRRHVISLPRGMRLQQLHPLSATAAIVHVRLHCGSVALPPQALTHCTVPCAGRACRHAFAADDGEGASFACLRVPSGNKWRFQCVPSLPALLIRACPLNRKRAVGSLVATGTPFRQERGVSPLALPSLLAPAGRSDSAVTTPHHTAVWLRANEDSVRSCARDVSASRTPTLRLSRACWR